MRRLLCVLLCLFGVCIPAEAVPIDAASFPDPALREAVRVHDIGEFYDEETQEWVGANDGLLGANECARANHITVWGAADLRGIEYFPNIEHLDCSYGSVSHLDLSRNPRIKLLLCFDTQLETVNLSGYSAVVKAYFTGTPLKHLNVSGCSSLEELHCNDCKLEDLNISGCSSLKRLYCDSNNLTRLNAGGCGSLEMISCWNNKLSSASFSGCSSLKYLALGINQLEELNLGGCRSLENFFCNNNKLKKLDLSGMNNLREVQCQENELETLKVANCHNLNSLWCWTNKLNSLDIDSCGILEVLYCDANQLAALDASHSIITDLHCNAQNISYDKGLDITQDLKYEFDFSNLMPKDKLSGVLEDTIYVKTFSDGYANPVSFDVKTGKSLFDTSFKELYYTYNTRSVNDGVMYVTVKLCSLNIDILERG